VFGPKWTPAIAVTALAAAVLQIIGWALVAGRRAGWTWLRTGVLPQAKERSLSCCSSSRGCFTRAMEAMTRKHEQRARA
jgi:hypothetical protein